MEEICAVFILAIGVFAVVAAIGMARTSVVSDSTQEAAAAQAQELADSLISELSQKSAVPADIGQVGTEVAVGGIQAVNVATENGFTNSGITNQFCIAEVQSKDASGIDGYNVICRTYYNGGKNFVQMKAYASARGNNSP